MDRRSFLIGSIGLAGAAALAACTSDSDGSRKGSGSTGGGAGKAPTDPDQALAAPGTPGLVDEEAFQARAEEYLKGATSSLDPSGPVSIGAFLIAAHRSKDFTWEPTSVTTETLQPVWDHIDEWRDTRDFQLMYLHWVLGLADGSSEMTTLDPKVLAAIEDRMADNRYQWNDPLPEDRIDNQWFWSENHLIIGLVNEYLAGQRMPERTFPITGLTGAEHQERARPAILDWISERARFGFFEWHSNTYMKYDYAPLLTLVEFADDPEIVSRAAAVIDLCFYDVATHTIRGAYGVTHGRAYKVSKTNSLVESSFQTAKLLFDATAQPFNGPDIGPAFLIGSTKYRLPAAIQEAARSSEVATIRERHGVVLAGWSFATPAGTKLPARVGSADYPPEVTAGRPVTGKSDVHQLHTLMVALLDWSERDQIRYARGCLQENPRMRPPAETLLDEWANDTIERGEAAAGDECKIQHAACNSKRFANLPNSEHLFHRAFVPG